MEIFDHSTTLKEKKKQLITFTMSSLDKTKQNKNRKQEQNKSKEKKNLSVPPGVEPLALARERYVQTNMPYESRYAF